MKAGDLSIENLKKAISKSKSISLERFIYSIGIRHIGQENAKILAAFFSSIKEFSLLFDEKKRKSILRSLIELDGIGETQIQAIQSFFSNRINTKITNNLLQNLSIEDYIIKIVGGKFSNKKIMFTGGFENMSRSEAKSIAENNGAKVLSTMSKKINILVVGDNKPTKKKIEQAQELKIKIMSEKEWIKILDS